MSILVEIKDGVTPALKSFDKQMRGLLENSTLRAAEEVAGNVRREVIKRLAKDPTGNLARSFRPSLVQKSKRKMVAGVFSDVVYAEIQDQGGTIFPKKKKLAVPLPGAPVPRGKWPRDFARGELFRMGSVLAKARKRGKAIPMFALVSSVRIRGVQYIDAAILASNQGVEKILVKMGDLTISRSIREGAK